MDEQTQLTKKERRELRRKEKEQTQESQKRQRATKKNMLWLTILVLVVAGLYSVTNKARKQPSAGQSGGAISSTSVPVLGKNHISENAPTPKYNSNPPTSGPHAGPVDGGFYRGEVKDINAVHSLEHGYIWITYKNVDDETLKKLEDIGKRFSGSVVVSSREANDSPIALASWGSIAKIEPGAFDEEAIADFIRKNRNKSPEKFAR